MFIISTQLMMLNSAMFLLIFCLLYLPIDNKGLYKSLTMIVHLSLFLSSFISFFTGIFWCFALRLIHIKNCHGFLEKWPLYHYVMLIFMPNNFPCSEVCSVQSIVSQAYFWLVLMWHIVLHPFNLSVFLYLKCISIGHFYFGSLLTISFNWCI